MIQAVIVSLILMTTTRLTVWFNPWMQFVKAEKLQNKQEDKAQGFYSEIHDEHGDTPLDKKDNFHFEIERNDFFPTLIKCNS